MWLTEYYFTVLIGQHFQHVLDISEELETSPFVSNILTFSNRMYDFVKTSLPGTLLRDVLKFKKYKQGFNTQDHRVLNDSKKTRLSAIVLV